MSEPEPEITYNNFKDTTVRGTFNNSDSPDGTLHANATFDRNLTIKGHLILGDFTTQTGGNIKLKIDDIENTITTSELLKACKSQTAFIDQFIQYYDQFTVNSQFEWAFL